MLSHGYWQRRFGGDPTVVGRTLTVNAEPAEIIGVMPEGFRIRDTDADLLMGPMRFDRSQLMLVPFAYASIARLKPGMTIADANADIARMIPIWLESWAAPPGADKRVYADVWRIGPALQPLKEDVVGPIDELLWFVMATIGVVLTIACANVANLMLIRGEARQHELAIRAVLGAGARRLGRALILEGLVIGSWPASPGLAERSNLRDLEMLAARPLLGALPEGAPSSPDFLSVARASLAPQLGGTWDPRAFRQRWDP